MLTKEQGEKFCDELFSLNIPSLNQSATMIISVKNGGKIDEDVKVGFVSRMILKLMYRAVVVEDITRHIAETTDLKWMDDDRRTVDRKMHIKGV